MSWFQLAMVLTVLITATGLAAGPVLISRSNAAVRGQLSGAGKAKALGMIGLAALLVGIVVFHVLQRPDPFRQDSPPTFDKTSSPAATKPQVSR